MKESRRFELDRNAGRLRFKFGIGNVPNEGETDGDGGLAAEMKSDSEGNGNYTTVGSAPQNEQWTKGPAEMLVQALNRRGEVCTNLRRPTADPECDFVADTSASGRLRIQVTRVPDETHWKLLNTTGLSEGPIDTPKLAVAILEIAQNKAERYPTAAVPNLHLVIDGTWSPQALAQGVRKELQAHWREFASLGFLGIWLVSPADTIRLDEADEGEYLGAFRVVRMRSVATRGGSEDDR